MPDLSIPMIAANHREPKPSFKTVFAYALRAQAMGESMRLRSGLSEGLDVTLRLRKPANAMELYDWMAQDVNGANAPTPTAPSPDGS